MNTFSGLHRGKTLPNKLMEKYNKPKNEKAKKNVLFILLFLVPGTVPGVVTGVQEINVC